MGAGGPYPAPMLRLLVLLGLFASPGFALVQGGVPREDTLRDRWMSGGYEPLPAGSLEATGAGLVLPLVSRSERVTRAVLEDGLVRLWCVPSRDVVLRSWTIGWIQHRIDERVLGTGTPLGTTRGWWIVGEPRVPAGVRGCDPELLFRQDGLGAVLGEGVSLTAPEGVRGRYLVPLDGGAALVETLGGVAGAGTTGALLSALGVVDQVGYTTATPVEAQVQLVQELRVGGESMSRKDGGIAGVAGEPLVLEVSVPPEVGEGETWSLVLHYELVGGEPVQEANAANEGEPQLLELGALDRVFLHQEGPALQMDIRPTMGPGAAWGDVNGDGHLDLYLVQGAGREGGPALTNRLLLGDGAGGLRDGTEAAGVGDVGAGMGALLFDADGDGDLDLFVANYGKDVLYANDGAGRFQDVTAEAGLALELWSASAAAADYDGDGDLDLYVTAYLDYDPAKMPPAAELNRYQRDDPIEMLPFAFPGERNALYRNESGPEGLRFVEVAEELGVHNPEGLSMQAVWWDFDRDGDQDLYVANDVSFNVLYRNDGGTFTDITFAVGLDDPRGGMGLEAGDVDRDGDEDILLTNWQLETNALYLNNAVRARSGKTRRARFHDGTVAAGLGPAGIGKTSWSPVLFDLDLDGDLDLYVANGYTSPDYQSTGICVGQRDDLFRNDGRGRFRAAHGAARVPLALDYVSRAAVACDYDRDGDVDLVVTANNGPVQLLVGRAADLGLGAFVGVRLRGPGPNPFGIGAEVTVLGAEGRKPLRRSVRAGSGYLGGGPPELHFGLGPEAGDEVRIEVRWPDGVVTTHTVASGEWHTLERS